jgi:hypothetical protein
VRICYIEKRFGFEAELLITRANLIIQEYQDANYTITLRQLYYQLVARGLIENSERSYKRVGSVIADARMAGRIDWEAIEDRTRNVRALGHWASPQDIVASCAKQYREDLWWDQPQYVEVWVEKDALVGVVQAACEPLDVPYFSCRGYTSASEMWQAAMRLIDATKRGHEVTIIHLGDHDPSGIDMTRDIGDRLGLFLGHEDMSVTVRRIALNMNQVERYNPPPNPAKVTDARYDQYQRQYGDESWELDALEPGVMVALIRETITEYIDESRWNASVARIQAGRDTLSAVANLLNHDAEGAAASIDAHAARIRETLEKLRGARRALQGGDQ